MSMNRSVGRITATEEKVHSASTQAKVRSTFKSKKDRSPNLCAFAFADGRQCRTPRCSGHLHFCYFHAQKEAESLAAQQVGQDISRFLPTKLLTACDLGVAMSRLFCAVAQGQVKPKVASTLAYLAQTMLQSIPIAQDEYINSFDTNAWRSAVRVSFRHDDPPSTPAPQPACPEETRRAPKPPASALAPTPPVEAAIQPGSSASSSSTSPAPPPPSHQPACPERTRRAPSPHTPLPRTGAEFFQQVMAGLNSPPSDNPAPPEPSRARSVRPGSTGEPGSSGSSSSSATSTDSAPAPTSSTQPATPSLAPQRTSTEQSQPTQNTQHNSLPAEATPAPPPLPPGFGAPANWEVLIPPKPRRRFSRLP